MTTLRLTVLLMFVLAIVVTATLALLVKGLCHAYRHWLVRREMAGVSTLPPYLLHRGRAVVDRSAVSRVRPGDGWDPDRAGKILPFTERLATRGEYVNELSIERRVK